MLTGTTLLNELVDELNELKLRPFQVLCKLKKPI